MFSFSFADLREAVNAMNKIRQNCPGWSVSPVTAHEISDFTGVTKLLSVPRDGEFAVTAYADLPEWKKIAEHLDAMIEGVIASFGPIRTFRAIEKGMCMRKYHVEYYNTHHATYAFSCLDGYRVEVIVHVG